MEVIKQVFIMFLLIFTGVICYKLKIINTEALSSVVIYISNPATLFIAFQSHSAARSEQLAGLGYAAFLSFISLFISIFVAFILIRGTDKKKIAVEQLSLILTNCGFMGIPLVRGLFGDEGVFYLAAFIAVNNIAVWTLGVYKMRGGELNASNIISMVKSPALIAIALGVICFITGFILPTLLLEAVNYAANLTTPLAMLVAGATIACVDFKKLIKKYKILYVSFLRLLVIPMLTYAAFILIITVIVPPSNGFVPPSGGLIASVVLAAAACPSAAMCVILAVKYDKDGMTAIYASEIFAATTLLSMVTLPLVMALPL